MQDHKTQCCGAAFESAIEAAGQGASGTAAANTDSVAEWKSAQSIITQALDLYGRIDGVVNNAGNLRDVIFHRMSEDDFDAVVKVHLKGSFNLSRAAAPHFKSEETGAFVHMTSTSGLIGNFGPRLCGESWFFRWKADQSVLRIR